MADESPWGDEPDYDPTIDVEEPPGAVAPQVPVSVSVTLKSTGGFDAPWIVVKGPDMDSVSRELWKLSEASREAFENGDVLLGVSQAAAEFAGKGELVGLTKSQPRKNDSGSGGGSFTNAAGTPVGKNIQQPGKYVPQWAVGLEIPIGDVSGLPMKPKEGNGANGYWAMWADPRPWNDIKDLPKHERDTPVNAPKK